MQNLLDQWYTLRPLVFGHRGASAYAPMNTIPAFKLAAEQGAHGVELDVWLSRDRHLVIVHDSTVDHTTDGSGYIWNMTLAELKSLDASHRFAGTHRGARIPTLDEVFDAVGQRLYVNVEIKADAGMIPGVEAAVAECITRHNMRQRVIVSSFSAQVLWNFRHVMPEVPIGFLHMGDTPDDERAMMADVPHEADHPYHAEISAEYMAWARANGYRVNTWTVNDPGRAFELRALGVDAIMTDHPDVILDALRG